MAIELGYFYAIENNTVDSSTVQFDFGFFDRSISDITAFFAGDLEAVEIKIYRQNIYIHDNDNIEAIRCMMKDIKNEKSITYKLLEKEFDYSDVVEKKVAIFRYLIEKLFTTLCQAIVWRNSEDYKNYTYDLPAAKYLRFALPLDVAKRCSLPYTDVLDYRKLSTREIATYIMPFYYQEIGWWDNERLRNDSAKMEKWATSWFRF